MVKLVGMIYIYSNWMLGWFKLECGYSRQRMWLLYKLGLCQLECGYWMQMMRLYQFGICQLECGYSRTKGLYEYKGWCQVRFVLVDISGAEVCFGVVIQEQQVWILKDKECGYSGTKSGVIQEKSVVIQGQRVWLFRDMLASRGASTESLIILEGRTHFIKTLKTLPTIRRRLLSSQSPKY